MRRLFFAFTSSLLLFVLLWLPQAMAQSIEIEDKLSTTGNLLNLNVIAGGLIRNLLGFVGVIALVMLLWAGWNWVSSAGSPEKMKTATETLKWVGIGLAVIFGSYIILRVVFTVFGQGTIEGRGPGSGAPAIDRSAPPPSRP